MQWKGSGGREAVQCWLKVGKAQSCMKYRREQMVRRVHVKDGCCTDYLLLSKN